MFKKLDETLISLHQKILDCLNIEPRKAADFMFKVLTLLIAVHVGLMFDKGITGFMWITLLLSPVMAIVAFMIKEASLGGMHGQMIIYRLWLVIAVFIPLSLTPTAIAFEFRLLAEILMTYFAACQKPKPPRRKSHVSRVLHHST